MVYPEISESKYATNWLSVIIPPPPKKTKKIAQFNYVPRRNPVFVGTKLSHPSIPLVLKLKRKLKIKQDFLHTHSSSSTPS